MKNVLLGFFLFFTLTTMSQDCNGLFFKEGTLLEYTQFDKKGKEISKNSHKTKTVSNLEGKITAVIEFTTVTDKETTVSSEYKVLCADGIIAIDMIRFFDNNQIANYSSNDFNVEMQGNLLEFPNNMESTVNLNEGAITVKVYNNDIKIVTATLNISNRKVLGKEEITTSAGSFACTKIAYDFESRIGFLKVKGSGVEWYNKDKVVVKSESYNKKGKLTGYQELTKIN
ncbi:TapB family protein [Aureibaculum marinum]|nr:hypothetical protein [Aureibaculum marinum]